MTCYSPCMDTKELLERLVQTLERLTLVIERSLWNDRDRA
jgi:hypothetical protein